MVSMQITNVNGCAFICALNYICHKIWMYLSFTVNLQNHAYIVLHVMVYF